MDLLTVKSVNNVLKCSNVNISKKEKWRLLNLVLISLFVIKMSRTKQKKNNTNLIFGICAFPDDLIFLF